MASQPQHEKLAKMIKAAESVGKTVAEAWTEGKDVRLKFKTTGEPSNENGMEGVNWSKS